MDTKYELSYYEIDELESGSDAKSKDFDNLDEAMEGADILNLDYVDFGKGDILITEFFLDEKRNKEAARFKIKAIIEDGEIVNWI